MTIPYGAMSFAPRDAVRTFFTGPSPKAPPKRTPLTSQEEQLFRRWYEAWAQKGGLDPDPDHPLHKYDWRGAYKSGATGQIHPEDGQIHWPSEYKDDDHPNRIKNGVDTRSGNLMVTLEKLLNITPR